MKHQTINLVKFKAFSKRIQAPLCHAVGYLETLWIFAQIQARDGDLSKFTSLEIAGWIEFPGEPNALIDALVECRWLDRTEDKLTVHDWDSHKPNWLKGVDAKRVLGSVASFVPSSEPGADPGTLPSKEPPKPNLTQPNLTISAAAWAAAEVSFRGLDSHEVARLANRLQKSSRGLPKDFIWQSVCIAEVLSAGMISEICTKIDGGRVQKPKTYIEAALRKEAERIGIDWKDLLPLVPKPKFKEPANA